MKKVLSITLTVTTVVLLVVTFVVVVVNSFTEGKMAFLTGPLVVALGVLIAIRLVSVVRNLRSKAIAPILDAGSVQSRAFGFAPSTFSVEESVASQPTSGTRDPGQESSDSTRH